MGQKVNPITFRLGTGQRTASSLWFSSKANFADALQTDYKTRTFIHKTMGEAGINDVKIERTGHKYTVTVACVRPGVVIGKKGELLTTRRRELAKEISWDLDKLQLSIEEVKKPDLKAALVAQQIAKRIERRGMYRRVMTQHISSVMKAGALGVKICLSGRLGGAEIARSEWLTEGRMQLQTIRSDIDFAELQAHTTYGVIGVKVWICVDPNKRRFTNKQKKEV